VVLVVGRGCGRGALGGGGEGEESEGDAEIHLAFLLSRKDKKSNIKSNINLL
jgi:hypothetical protein